MECVSVPLTPNATVEKYPPAIPDDLELLVKPKPGADKLGLGFLRYANAKLATVSWMYALDRHLQKVSTEQ